MHKLWRSTYKEIILLTRDWGGLMVLFVMPLALIITITLIQDGSFKKINHSKTPILFVNQDGGSVSALIQENLNDQNSYILTEDVKGEKVTEAIARAEVAKGNFQLAVIIPPNLSVDLDRKVSQNVAQILSEFGLEDTLIEVEEIAAKQIKLYFDPALQPAFKVGVMNGIDQMISKIESSYIYTAFQEELSEDPTAANAFLTDKSFVKFEEINPLSTEQEILPNSTQHNVPAWTLFAIFFIVIPLSINMVKEKNQGTFVRLRTNPVSYLTVLGGKTITYLIISFLQFLLMLLMGMYVLPMLDLPALSVGSNFFTLCIVAIFSGLAAIGFGLLLGTLCTTPEQSAPFGATAVVILAAVGGVWVPVFVMPSFMQWVSNISPMNWGLNAFYDLFLRGGNLIDVLPEIGLLFAFFILTLGLAVFYDRKRNAI